MEWIKFGKNEYGSQRSEDDTRYIVSMDSRDEDWTVCQYLNWPARKPGDPILTPPPEGARMVTRRAPTLQDAKRLAEEWELERRT